MRMLRNKQLMQQQQQQLFPNISSNGDTINYIDIKPSVVGLAVQPASSQRTAATASPSHVQVPVPAATHPPLTSHFAPLNVAGSQAISNYQQADMASVDSSDTYASCQTHPFFSQGDLTSEIADAGYALDLDTSNLYINPLGGAVKVKKSASGDTALRSMAGGKSFDDDQTSTDQPRTSSSITSLNETPVPKHRKARFQSSKPRARFDEQKLRSQDSLDERNNSSKQQQQQTRSTKRKLFESKSLSSATKLINQHLFGHHQSLRSKGTF